MTATRSPSPPAPFRLVTLGRVGLHHAESGRLVLGPGKPFAVLTYLALTPGRRASRDTLLDLCWADVEPARGRPALRQSLFLLRRVLGDGALTGNEELQLVAPLEVDRDRFLAAIEAGETDVAVAEYGGAFLPAFGVPGGAAFEHWADLERDRLASLHFHHAELAVRRHLNASRGRDARRLAERVRELHPEREAAWRLVLECALATGDGIGVKLEADAIERRSRDQGIAPEPATRTLLLRARDGAPRESRPSDPDQLAAELTGRHREFAAITSAWAKARGGPTRHLHVSAPAGLGKSRLLHEVAARLRASGEAVVVATAVTGDRDIPYAFLGELSGQLAALPGAVAVAPGSAAALVAINPALSSRFSVTPDTAVGEEALRRRTHAVLDLIHAVCGEQPIALLIDDAHWIDRPSLRVIEAICDRLGPSPCLCVTAARPEGAVVRAATVELELHPLSEAETGELIAALGALPAGAAWAATLGTQVHRTSRGVPLLILQTLRLALDQHLLTLESGTWGCDDPARLSALLGEGEAIRHRIASLPADAAQVLSALAVVGTPATREELCHDADAMPDDVEARLRSLERMGLIRRTSEGWLPAHDEVAGVARGLLSADALRALRHRIGVRLVASPSGDPQRELRGCRHLFDAGDRAALAGAFRRLVQRARLRGDRRPFADLAREVVGARGAGAQVADLLSQIPWHWRLGLWSPRRLAAGMTAVAIGVLGTTAAVTWRAGRTDTLPTLWYLAPDRGAARVAADPGVLGRSTGVVVARPARSALEAAARVFPEYPPLPSPDGARAVWNVHVGGAATIDIWIRTPDGERNLTDRARDQYATDWTPDGRYIVGASNEWSPSNEGAYDIAVFDPVTGEARQVTRGPEHDRRAFASPDGSRIAFVRESGDRPTEVCVVPFDGGDPADCRLPLDAPVVGVYGWTSTTELLVVLHRDGTSPLFRYDWITGTATPVLGPYVEEPVLSPDRRWVAVRARIAGVPGVREWLLPLDRPTELREVRTADTATGSVRWWEGSRNDAALVDTLVIADSNRTLLLGVSRRLVVGARRRDGSDAPIHSPLRWHSSDTTVATVDAAGVVHPLAGGEVTIAASLSGWRASGATFHIEGARDQTLIQERWDATWATRWITFGDPLPTTAIGPGGTPGFWNRGDGVYHSFGLFRGGFAPSAGLGVEVLLSTPITRATWLRTVVGFVSDADTLRLLRAPLSGPPAGLASSTSGCGVTYPPADGAFGRANIGVGTAVSALIALGDLEALLSSGQWWRLRLQLLPDGRCGVAVNGTPLWLSPEPVALGVEYWLHLGDSSAEARLLHGPLEVWQGVRTDIDWTGVDRERNR